MLPSSLWYVVRKSGGKLLQGKNPPIISQQGIRRSVRCTTSRNNWKSNKITRGIVTYERPNSSITTTLHSWKQNITNVLVKPRVLPFPRWLSPRHVTITLTEVFGHLSFILILCSYAVDDYILLRFIAVAGSVTILVFSNFQPTWQKPVWFPLKYNILFITVNCYRIWCTLSDQYSAEEMSEEYKRYHCDYFPNMELVDFYKLVRLGEMETFQEEEVVLQQGQLNEYLRFVIDGELSVIRDGHLVEIFKEGNFISEHGLHAGVKLTGSIKSSATIVPRTATVKCMRWNRTQLIPLLESNKRMWGSFQSTMLLDAVKRLKCQRQLVLRRTLRTGSDTPEDTVIYLQMKGEAHYSNILEKYLHQLMENDGNIAADVKKATKNLEQYRNIHHINYAYHLQALRQFGWTEAEFKAGQKNESRK